MQFYFLTARGPKVNSVHSIPLNIALVCLKTNRDSANSNIHICISDMRDLGATESTQPECTFYRHGYCHRHFCKMHLQPLTTEWRFNHKLSSKHTKVHFPK